MKKIVTIFSIMATLLLFVAFWGVKPAGGGEKKKRHYLRGSAVCDSGVREQRYW